MRLEITRKKKKIWEDTPIFVDYVDMLPTHNNMLYDNQDNVRRLIDELNERILEISRVPRNFL